MFYVRTIFSYSSEVPTVIISTLTSVPIVVYQVADGGVMVVFLWIIVSVGDSLAIP